MNLVDERQATYLNRIKAIIENDPTMSDAGRSEALAIMRHWAAEDIEMMNSVERSYYTPRRPPYSVL